MATVLMKPEDICSTMKKFTTAKSVKELDTPEFKGKMELLRDTTFDYLHRKLTSSENTIILKAFSSGDPVTALKSLIKFRKGSKSPNIPGFLLESKTNIAWVYAYFIRSLASVTWGNESFGMLFIENGCIALVLQELDSKEFRENKDRPTADSPTAYAINAYLLIIYNITTTQDVALGGRLGDALRANNFFQKLSEYTKSKYENP